MSVGAGLGVLIGKVCVGICLLDGGSGVAVQCPPLRDWSPGFQQELLGELQLAPKRKALTKVIGDAIQDRDIARACAKR